MKLKKILKLMESENEIQHFSVNDKLFYQRHGGGYSQEIEIKHIVKDPLGKVEYLKCVYNDGETEKIFPYEFKNLHKSKPKKDNYTIVKEVGIDIYEIIDVSSNQISALFDVLKTDKKSGNFRLSFPEEVKDGRSPKFDYSAPLRLKNKTIGPEEFKIKILDISFSDQQEDEESEYNRYLTYYYDVKFERVT